MRRITLILAVVLIMVALVVASAGTALAIPPGDHYPCQGLGTAHANIPESNVLGETPGHEHVPRPCT